MLGASVFCRHPTPFLERRQEVDLLTADNVLSALERFEGKIPDR